MFLFLHFWIRICFKNTSTLFIDSSRKYEWSLFNARILTKNSLWLRFLNFVVDFESTWMHYNMIEHHFNFKFHDVELRFFLKFSCFSNNNIVNSCNNYYFDSHSIFFNVIHDFSIKIAFVIDENAFTQEKTRFHFLKKFLKIVSKQLQRKLNKIVMYNRENKSMKVRRKHEFENWLIFSIINRR